MLWKIFNRRKHQRFFADQNAFVVLQPCTRDEKRLQIIDISEGGCGFVYYGDGGETEMPGLIALTAGRDTYFEQMKISPVSDLPVSGPFRRKGVEFKWLAPPDKMKLGSFIERVSVCKC